LDDAITIVTTDVPSARRDRGDSVRRVVESTIAAERLHASLDRCFSGDPAATLA